MLEAFQRLDAGYQAWIKGDYARTIEMAALVEPILAQAQNSRVGLNVRFLAAYASARQAQQEGNYVGAEKLFNEIKNSFEQLGFFYADAEELLKWVSVEHAKARVNAALQRRQLDTVPYLARIAANEIQAVGDGLSGQEQARWKEEATAFRLESANELARILLHGFDFEGASRILAGTSGEVKALKNSGKAATRGDVARYDALQELVALGEAVTGSHPSTGEAQTHLQRLEKKLTELVGLAGELDAPNFSHIEEARSLSQIAQTLAGAVRGGAHSVEAAFGWKRSGGIFLGVLGVSLIAALFLATKDQGWLAGLVLAIGAITGAMAAYGAGVSTFRGFIKDVTGLIAEFAKFKPELADPPKADQSSEGSNDSNKAPAPGQQPEAEASQSPKP